MTPPRSLPAVPAHVWVMLGASTAGYALVLAGVAAIQSNAEAILISARRPAVEGVAQLAAGHEELIRRLDAAQAGYATAADTYGAAGSTLDALHEQFAEKGANRR